MQQSQLANPWIWRIHSELFHEMDVFSRETNEKIQGRRNFCLTMASRLVYWFMSWLNKNLSATTFTNSNDSLEYSRSVTGISSSLVLVILMISRFRFALMKIVKGKLIITWIEGPGDDRWCYIHWGLPLLYWSRPLSLSLCLCFCLSVCLSMSDVCASGGLLVAYSHTLY